MPPPQWPPLTPGLSLPAGFNFTMELDASADLEDGTVALVIICLILIFLTILAIAFHYCNFKGNEKYEKLERENELIEVNLYESDN